MTQPSLQQGPQFGIRNAQHSRQGLQSSWRSDSRRRNGQLIERETRRRGIRCKGACPIKVTYLKTCHALVQNGFKCRFPAWLNMQLLPQATQLAEFVLSKPGLKCAFLLHIFLQAHERG